MIPVTKTYFPSLEHYQMTLQNIWDSGWLTNRGDGIKLLEKRIQEYLQTPSLIAMNNGTTPIQIALKILGNKGEIITTPFSYVATTSAIVWEECTPVFVDIHPDTLTIDASKIENSITEKTTCILATHVFGNACEVEKIEALAKKYHLKVIYDAAHCFGTKYKGASIFHWGDVATCSFHATKIFHTAEGGALFTKDQAIFNKAFQLHNFGHITPETFEFAGINGKISELHAAMGLCILDDFALITRERTKIVQLYNQALSFNGFQTQSISPDTETNGSYYPIWFDSHETMSNVLHKLNEVQIYPRRYFYPSLNTLPYLPFMSCPISEKISQNILCLPLYVGLTEDIILEICNIINSNA
jgi:dTDP-4-amino-4,6-dideoxygalactose transaminase